MPIVTPAIRGTLGNTEYFISKMNTQDLIQGVSPASLDESWWDNLTLGERMQREADTKRVIKEIAPYLAEAEDRFFTSLIILVRDGDVHFESLTRDLGVKLPHAYLKQSADIGYITIDGGRLIILDGQHRWLAIKAVRNGDVEGPFADAVLKDQVSVIFIRHESEQKTRRIFNKVNRYAKQVGRGDNIITDEDDGYAIVTRELIGDTSSPLFTSGKKKESSLVNWKQNTLSPKSPHLTTISALYEMTKVILRPHEEYKHFEDKKKALRPPQAELESATELVMSFWAKLFDLLTPYKVAIEKADRSASVMSMRKEDEDYSLLFKPAGQIAFVQALVNAQHDFSLSLDELVKRANALENRWGLLQPHWVNIIMSPSGAINAKADARERATALIEYLLVGDLMSEERVKQVYDMYNKARGFKPELKEGQNNYRAPEALPNSPNIKLPA